VVAAIGEIPRATGRSAITIGADVRLDDVPATGAFDLLLIPGGPGVARLRDDNRAAMLAGDFHSRGKWIAAICAAPLVLHDAGLLAGRRFTAHFSAREALPDASDERVVVDGRLITSRGAGTALDFGLAIITALAGAEAAENVATAIMM